MGRKQKKRSEYTTCSRSSADSRFALYGPQSTGSRRAVSVRLMRDRVNRAWDARHTPSGSWFIVG